MKSNKYCGQCILCGQKRIRSCFLVLTCWAYKKIGFGCTSFFHYVLFGVECDHWSWSFRIEILRKIKFWLKNMINHHEFDLSRIICFDYNLNWAHGKFDDNRASHYEDIMRGTTFLKTTKISKLHRHPKII